MARLLEDLEPGTPVYLGDERVGEVRGVYAEGTARLAEYVLIDWTKRDTVVLIPTKDILSLEERGVILMGDDPRPYDGLPAFEPGRYPTIRKIG